MKLRLVIAFVLAVVLTAVGIFSGVIGLSYPRVVDNQPLLHPTKIESVDGLRLALADGRVIHLEGAPGDLKPGAMVDVEEDPGTNEVVLYGAKRMLVCGNPWQHPIQIPLFADTVRVNRRVEQGWGWPADDSR